MADLIDLIGQRFGTLTVIKRSYPNTKDTYANWLCKCECGNEKIVSGHNLRKGRVKSCGCLNHLGSKCRYSSKVANIRTLIKIYKRNSEVRGYTFELTEKQFTELTQKNCYYCGLPPNNIFKLPRDNGNSTFKYNGIDRVNNNEGYTIQNTVPCCKDCNRAKGGLTTEEFQDWAKRLYENLFSAYLL